MKIRVTLVPSTKADRCDTIDLDDLNTSEERWLEFSEEVKQSMIESWLDEHPEQPYWELDSFEEVQ